MNYRFKEGYRSEAILFACERSGQTSKPWEESGFCTLSIDLESDNQDIRLVSLSDLLEIADNKIVRFTGMFAMPPCTHLAASGARWWKDKGDTALLDALSVADACIRLAESLRPHGMKWFALENPVGRLSSYLGKPRMTFNPCDYGDPYTKKTCLWGWGFNTGLVKTPVFPAKGSLIHNMPQSKDRASRRSETPPGFAKAFFDANRDISSPRGMLWK